MQAGVASQITLPGAANAALFGGEKPQSDWEQVPLELEPGIVLLDIAFVDDKRGFLLGSRQTLMETNDGGATWKKRDVSSLNGESRPSASGALQTRANLSCLVR